MKGKRFLILLLAAWLMHSGSAAGLLQCSISQDCGGGVDLFHISDYSNAHAELPGQNNYNLKVCCSGDSLGTQCSGNYDVVLKLSSQTNAHAEKSTESNYNNKVCLSSNSDEVECVYASECYSGSEVYSCVATISGDTNAHVAGCDSSQGTVYSTKVCCRVGSVKRLVIADLPPSWQNADAYVSAQCSDPNDSECNNAPIKKMRVYDSNPGSCPSDPDSYDLNGFGPVKIDSHKWVCAIAGGSGTYITAGPEEALVDKTAPSISDDYSYTDQWVNSSQTINLDVADSPQESPIEGVYYCIGDSCDPMSGTSLSAPYSISINYDAYGSLNYAVKDEAGNTGTGGTTVMIDVTPPVSSLNPEPDPDQWYGKAGFATQIECSDSTSGCSSTYWCSFEKGSPECTNFQQYSGGNIEISCTGSCTRIIKYYSVDSAGNPETPKLSGEINIDTSLPSCTLNPLDEYTNSTEITLSWSVDSDSPVSDVSIEYSSDSGSFQELGTYPGTQTTATFTLSPDHLYAFRCIPTSSAGQGFSNQVSTYIDQTAPFSAISLPEWSNSSFVVSWSGQDNGSGIDFYEVQWRKGESSWNEWLSTNKTSSLFGESGDPVQVSEGDTFSFRVRAFDRAGNTGNWSQDKTTTTDLTPPNCSMDTLPEITNSTFFGISWSGQDSLSGISHYEVQYREDSEWNDVSGAEHTENTSITFMGEDGKEYAFRCRAFDRAGNTGNWSQEVSTTIDHAPPSVIEEYNKTVAKNESLVINATITDPQGIDEASLYFKSTLIKYSYLVNASLQEWRVSWEINASLLENQTYGNHSFFIRTRDKEGNEGSVVYRFTLTECRPNATRSCGTDAGECEPGYQVCNYQGFWDDSCMQSLGPSNETCDGKDNDCDGEIDEGIDCACVPGETQECGVTDEGVCKYGTQTCNDDGEWGECKGNIDPSPEECNGLDDDCDGEIDEGSNCCSPSDPPQPYGISNIGECRLGEKVCENGVWVVSKEPINPSPEICDDGKDNDCDGKTDWDDEDCQSCTNGIQDGNEEGVDCGGSCPNDCMNVLPVILILAGAVILVVLGVVWFMLKSKGEELTWETLRKRWTYHIRS